MAPNCPKITKNRKIIVICVIFLITVMIPFLKHFISEFKWIKNFITHIISAKFLEFLYGSWKLSTSIVRSNFRAGRFGHSQFTTRPYSNNKWWIDCEIGGRDETEKNVETNFWDKFWDNFALSRELKFIFVSVSVPVSVSWIKIGPWTRVGSQISDPLSSLTIAQAAQ